MISSTFIILFLIALGLASALYYYLFLKRRAPPNFALAGLRIGVVLALLAAFFEPTLKFERLKTREDAVCVLIDASESMRLFRPESTVIPLLRAIDSAAKAGTGPAVAVRYFCFGDSLRRCPASGPLRFTDARSDLPASFEEKDVKDASCLLFVTDGNFTNASLPRGALQEKPCYYVTMPGVVSPRPYLNLELVSYANNVRLDSGSTAIVRLSGYRARPGELSLTCREGARVISRRMRPVKDSGYFSDTVAVFLASPRQGRFLYQVTAEAADDSLRASLYLPLTVQRGLFKAKIPETPPLLDRRFLAIALTLKNEWTIAGNDEKDCDALFAFSAAEGLTEGMASLQPRGIVVFFGAMPCSTAAEVSPATCMLVPNDPLDTLLSQFDIKEPAPPSALVDCGVSFLKAQRTVLSCAYTTTGSRKTMPDTLPFIITGRYKNHNAVAVAAHEVWRMGFLPLSLKKESETPSFMRYLAAFIQQRLLASLQQDFLCYPAAAGEYDSCTFSLLVPSDFLESQSEQKNQCSLGLRIESMGKSVFDSSYDCSSLYTSSMPQIKCGPLAHGNYFFKCTLSYGSRRREYSDSLYVAKNVLELSAQGQNTALLGQFALPMNSGDPKALRDLVSSARVSKRASVTDYFQITKSALLLSLCILLFSLEWLVRKKTGMD
jgi:hypothetical protein